MARRTAADTAAFGSDSFLDIVANVVGILIILVIAVGIRAKHAPLDPAADARTAARLASLHSAVRRGERQVVELVSQEGKLRSALETSRGERESRQAELARLQAGVAAAEAALRAAQGGAADNSLARRRAGERLLQLEQQLQEALASSDNTVVVQSYPTPISRAVDGQEAHFQLREGRLAYIPLDDLLDLLRPEAAQQVWKLKDLPETTNTVGPVGGFRLRYTMEKVEDVQAIPGGRRLRTYARLSQWTLIPVSSQVGEPLAAALAPSSQFRSVLNRLDARSATITLWTYPDSFAEFRKLKQELYALGFAVAGRPLPEGFPIAGSPHGSKSAAQ